MDPLGNREPGAFQRTINFTYKETLCILFPGNALVLKGAALVAGSGGRGNHLMLSATGSESEAINGSHRYSEVQGPHADRSL